MERILTRAVALQRHTELSATGTECVAEMRKKILSRGVRWQPPFSLSLPLTPIKGVGIG